MILLTKERKALGLSQAALSRRADLHNSTTSAIERGRMNPWPGQAEKLTRAMREAGWTGSGDLFAEVGE